MEKQKYTGIHIPNDPAEIPISRLDNHRDFRGRLFTLATAFKEIRKGNSTVGRFYGYERVRSDNYKSLTLKEATELARHHKRTNKEAYAVFKESMPAFCFGCSLDGRSPDTPTGILGIDLDDIEDISKAKSLALGSPYTLACFTTLGGNGLRILVKVDPVPTPETHRYAWFAVRNKYKFIANVDPAGKEMNKLSALVYDPELFANEKSYPIHWEIDKEAFLAEFPYTDIEQQALSGLPDEYRVAIEDLEYKENGWSRERLPCLFKHREGGSHDNDNWGSRANGMEVRQIKGGYEVRCHKCDGRTERFVANPQAQSVFSRYTPKLTYIPDIEPEMDTLQSLRSLLKDEVVAWGKRTQNTRKRHMLLLGTGAGTGKSTTTLVNLNQYADVSPTISLADEKFEKALEAGKDAMRHRSRTYNIDAAEELHPYEVHIGLNAELGEVPCAYPTQCNSLAQKGYVPSKVFCPSCPHIDKCKKQGYLSQYRLMREHDCVFLSWQDDFFSDPAYARRVEQIDGDKDMVLVLDEPNPADLPPKRVINTEILLQKSADSQGATHEFLTDLIAKLSTAQEGVDFVERTKALLEADKYRHALPIIDEQLAKIAVTITFHKADNPVKALTGEPLHDMFAIVEYQGQSVTCAVLRKKVSPVLFEVHSDITWIKAPNKAVELGEPYGRFVSLTEFCRLGFGSMESLESITRLPVPLTNFVSDLQNFVASSHSKTPPCHRTSEGWEYYLKPSMNARRGIMISAGDTEQEIRELYTETDIDIQSVVGSPPEWKGRNEFCQISTGRYTPRQSLYTKDTKTDEVALKTKGIDFINLILNEAKTGEKILVVCPKDFTSEGKLANEPLIAQMLSLPNLSVINHHHAEGVNNYSDCDKSFIFAYEPIPTEVEHIAKRIYRDADLSFEREQVNVEKGGVVLENANRYVDERVRRVFDKECEKRLMQAITRLRQMLNTGKKCYLLTSEPVSGLPVKPIFFTLGEAQGCQAEHGTLDTLSEYLKQRADMSIDQIAEVDNVTKSTAYRKTVNQRKQARADIETQILELKDQGLSVRKIADMLGFSRGKVEGALKKNKLS